MWLPGTATSPEELSIFLGARSGCFSPDLAPTNHNANKSFIPELPSAAFSNRMPVLTFGVVARGETPPTRRSLNACQHDEGSPEDASRTWRNSRERSDSQHSTPRGLGSRECRVDLRYRPAHLRVGPLVSLAHQAATNVRSRILRVCRAHWRSGEQRRARRVCKRRDARQLRALPSVPPRGGAHLPEPSHYRHRSGWMFCGVCAHPRGEYLED